MSLIHIRPSKFAFLPTFTSNHVGGKLIFVFTISSNLARSEDYVKSIRDANGIHPLVDILGSESLAKGSFFLTPCQRSLTDALSGLVSLSVPRRTGAVLLCPHIFHMICI
jgi:hypothetical protein